MNANFSEFSFGFAVTHEICQELLNCGFSAAPVFPTLRKEKHLGYDVKIPVRGFPLFLQFKLSEKLGKRAREWKIYKAPYFRVHLSKKSHSMQHQNLQKLANKGKGYYVCYVSPLFIKLQELNRAFNSQQVVRQCMFINVNRLDPIRDNKTHYFTFLRGNDLKLWSEPVSIEGKFTGDVFLDKLAGVLENRDSLYKIDSDYLYELREYLLGIIGQRELPLDFKKTQEYVIDDIVYLCRVYFGCEVLFVGLSERETKRKERILRLS